MIYSETTFAGSLLLLVSTHVVKVTVEISIELSQLQTSQVPGLACFSVQKQVGRGLWRAAHKKEPAPIFCSRSFQHL